MSKRKTKLIVLVGTPGSGKTFLLMKFLKFRDRNLILPSNVMDDTFDSANPKKLALSFEWLTDPKDFHEKRMIKKYDISNIKSFKGNAIVDLSSIEDNEGQRDMFKALVSQEGIQNAGLFIDDFKNYVIAKGTLPWGVSAILRNRRHRMLDIFLAAHSFSDINAEILQFGAEIIVFKTTIQPTKNFMEKISEHKRPELISMIHRVNNVVSRGEKKYSDYESANPGVDVPIEIIKEKFYCERFKTV